MIGRLVRHRCRVPTLPGAREWSSGRRERARARSRSLRQPRLAGRLRRARAREPPAAAGASATSPLSPTGHAPTARSSASTRRWPANGRTGSPTAHIDTATRRCHTGSTTTTDEGRTAHSETGHRSAAFTTSVGRTSSYWSVAIRPSGSTGLAQARAARHGVPSVRWCAVAHRGLQLGVCVRRCEPA